MNLRKLSVLVAVLLTLVCQSAQAENYQFSVTRKGSNVYKIDGKNILLHTQLCLELSLLEDVIFKSSGFGGELIFRDSKQSCDVKALYGQSTNPPGNYKVTVARESDDWYAAFGTNSFIKTSACLSLALGEEARLELVASGFGQLHFNDGLSCMVEGLYSKMRL